MAELLRIDISDFRDGLNTEDATHELLPTQSPLLQNIDLSQKGRIMTRNGTLKLNTTAISTATGIFGATYGKSLHLAATLTDLYKLNTSTGLYESLSQTLTSNAQAYFIEWNNYVWFVNGAEVPKKYSGSVITDIGDAPSQWATDKPEFITQWGERLWTLTAATSRLHWSKLENGENWTTTNDAGTHIFYGQDGYTATGFAPQKRGLVTFKQSSIHKITGFSPVSYRFDVLYDNIGCIAPRSICSLNNRIFFLAKFKGDYGVFVLDDAGGLTFLSDTITTTLNTITTGSDYLAAGVVYREKYRLSFPISGGWLTMVLNYKTGAWEYDSGNAAQCYYVSGGSLYGGSTTNGLVRQIDTGTNDDDTAITSYVRSKDYFFEAPELTKKLRYMMVWAKASGNWNLNINFRIDGKLLPKTYTMQLGTKGGLEASRHMVVLLDEEVQGSIVNIQFGTSTIDQPFELYKVQLYYELGSPITI